MLRGYLFSMSPAGPFVAGSYTTIIFKIKIGIHGIKPGGSIRIATPNMGWGQPFVTTTREWEDILTNVPAFHNPWKPINTTVEIKSQNKVIEKTNVRETFIPPKNPNNGTHFSEEILKYSLNWQWWISIFIENDSLCEGDEVIVTYGDTNEHPHGIRVQPWPEDNMWFSCIVDIEGNKNFFMVPGSPVSVNILPGTPEKTIAVLPSIGRTGENIVLKTAVTDKNLTPPAYKYTGNFDTKILGTAQQLKDSNNIIPVSSGIVRVEVKGPDIVKSNPMFVVDEESHTPNIYWGDLHAQSKYHQWHPSAGRGDSHMSPSELYDYAKNFSMLDFTAITDGFSAYSSNPGWHEIQQAAIDCYEPGKFVSLKGWECGMGVQGDKCVIYRSAEIEDYLPEMKASDMAPTPFHALINFYRNHPDRVLTIPHSFMKYMDWSVLDPELDRVMEIYSTWGSYESRDDNPLNSKRCPLNQSAQYVWSTGALLGVTAAGDSHLGYPGRSLSYSDRYYCQCFKAGICAVYADELTREAIWDALYNRYCYGTTGVRIILQFSVNGKRMGSVCEYAKDDEQLIFRKINVTVCGTDFIRRIDVIKNNNVAYRHIPESDYADFVWEDKLNEPPLTRDWYYIRVFQADGNAAWSSPIWIGPVGCSKPSDSNIQ